MPENLPLISDIELSNSKACFEPLMKLLTDLRQQPADKLECYQIGIALTTTLIVSIAIKETLKDSQPLITREFVGRAEYLARLTDANEAVNRANDALEQFRLLHGIPL